MNTHLTQTCREPGETKQQQILVGDLDSPIMEWSVLFGRTIYALEGSWSLTGKRGWGATDTLKNHNALLGANASL